MLYLVTSQMLENDCLGKEAQIHEIEEHLELQTVVTNTSGSICIVDLVLRALVKARLKIPPIDVACIEDNRLYEGSIFITRYRVF